MSLDVYLYESLHCPHCQGELDLREELYHANITHNLGRMADAAGIYLHLWRPDELGIERAEELIEPLKDGLKRLKTRPGEWMKYNSPNGWGTYEDFMFFVGKYFEACKENPDAIVEVSR